MRRALLLLATLGILAAPAVRAQISPARGPLPVSGPDGDMPLADYLALLRQIAPAAEEGARDYIAAFAQRCGRPLTMAALRRAMAEGDGDPVLMGLIRARHLQDAAARERLAGQIRCPAKEAR
jgi:hypothetical protein